MPTIFKTSAATDVIKAESVFLSVEHLVDDVPDIHFYNWPNYISSVLQLTEHSVPWKHIVIIIANTLHFVYIIDRKFSSAWISLEIF